MSPDNGGYNVVVQASDGGTMQTEVNSAMNTLNWFAVTVTVMDIEEEGVVSLRSLDDSKRN